MIPIKTLLITLERTSKTDCHHVKTSFIISSEYNFEKNHDVYVSEYHYSSCCVNPIQTGGELAKKMTNFQTVKATYMLISP